MGQTEFKLLVLDEAYEDTKDLRRYIPECFGTQTWKQTSAELAVTFGNARQFPAERLCAGDLSDFGGLHFREALNGRGCVKTHSSPKLN